MHHVRQISVAFTPFAKSGMEKKDVAAVQSILDKYVQPPQVETPTKVGKAKSKAVPLTQKNIGEHTQRHADSYNANTLAAAMVAADTPIPRPSKARKLLARTSDASGSKSAAAQPTPPSSRSRLLFASLLDDKAEHIYGTRGPAF